jgi:flagellar biosynthesis protein FlhF
MKLIQLINLFKGETKVSSFEILKAISLIEGKEISHYLQDSELEISEETFIKIKKYYLDNYPLEYLTNKVNFLGLDFFVNENVLIPREVTLSVKAYSKNNLYLFNSLVYGIGKESSVRFLIITVPDEIYRVQRRNYVRIPLCEEGFFSIKREFNLKNNENLEQNEKYRFVTKDFSAGGAAIVTKKQLSIGDKILINMKLKDEVVLENIEAEVVRESEQRPKKANEYQKNEKKNDNIGTYSLKDIISNNRKELTQKDKSFDLKGYSKEENRNSQPDENIELLKLIEENRKLSSKMDKGAEEFYSQKKEAIYNSANSTGLINNLEINKADEFKLSELKRSVDKLNKKLERSNIYLQEFKEELYKNSYSKTFIDSIISEIEDITFNENWRNDERIKKIFEQKITNCIKQANFKDLKGKVVFTGPTGVGKTTTLAKIATKLIKEQSKIAFVTIDTYRIAATDQLKIYADILDVPLSICYTPQELKITIESLLNYDTILIDTAGRSHKNNLQMGELKVFIDSIRPDYKIMLVSANSNPQEMINIYDSFSIIQPNCLIFTKIDEVTSYGQLFSFLEYSNLPLIGITDGQRVPEDLKFPDKEWFVSKAMREVFE